MAAIKALYGELGMEQRFRDYEAASYAKLEVRGARRVGAVGRQTKSVTRGAGWRWGRAGGIMGPAGAGRVDDSARKEVGNGAVGCGGGRGGSTLGLGGGETASGTEPGGEGCVAAARCTVRRYRMGLHGPSRFAWWYGGWRWRSARRSGLCGARSRVSLRVVPEGTDASSSCIWYAAVTTCRHVPYVCRTLPLPPQATIAEQTLLPKAVFTSLLAKIYKRKK